MIQEMNHHNVGVKILNPISRNCELFSAVRTREFIFPLGHIIPMHTGQTEGVGAVQKFRQSVGIIVFLQTQFTVN